MFLVGKIVSTFGNKGDVKILPSISPDDLLLEFTSLFIEQGEKRQELKISKSRKHKNIYVFSFDGINDMNVAEDLIGSSVYVPNLDVKELEEDEFFYHDLIGLNVYSENGDDIGVVDHIIKGGNDILVVKNSEGKEVMIPFVDEIVPEVNIPEKSITVKVIEGLLDD